MAKRGNKEGSIRLRRDGRWEGRVTVSGRRRSVYGRTRDDVRRQVVQAMSDEARGVPTSSRSLRVDKFLDTWLEESVRPTVRPRTFASYSMQVRVHIKPAVGRHALAKLTPRHVQEMLNDMTSGGLAPASVVYTRAVLRRALSQALKWGLVSLNAAALVDPPRSRRYEPQPLSPDQARTFLRAIQGDRLRALFYLALGLGLRQGELLGLCWPDVDLETETLRVRHALQRVGGQLQLVEPKTERAKRTLSIPPIVAAQLRLHRDEQAQERAHAGQEWVETGFVFTTTIGTPLDGSALTRRFQRLLRDNGLPRQRFHDLRHACATFLLSQGLSPRVVMETLGHSQISLTMNTYSHVLPEMQREAASRMDALLTARR